MPLRGNSTKCAAVASRCNLSESLFPAFQGRIYWTGLKQLHKSGLKYFHMV